jgi:FtsP/CotA-like multicopper oxidase with cupredoxin domain
VLQEGADLPSADSVRSPGATIVLRRGEPTSILVHNNTPQPTSVHWHGLEIESPFDGVVGVGGYATSPAPAITSGGTFEVRVTPPRSGSFMYHTHINDLIQQSRGLWGALLVLEPEDSWDPDRDLIFQIGEGVDFMPILNGRTEHPVQELQVGTDYRFRLMNISMGGPNLEFWLVHRGAPIRWMPLARDGYDLPSWQRVPGEARTNVSIGETRDMRVRFPRPGAYALEVRRGNGSLLTRQPITVTAP